MSRYTIYNLVIDVNRKLHGGKMSNQQSTIDEGRRTMISKITPVEMTRKSYMEQALYDQIKKYAVPYDMNYDNLVEIKALDKYHNVDTLDHPLELVYRRTFDQQRRRAKNVISIGWENGVKYALVNHPRGLKQCQHLLVNDANSLTANGSWNVGGNVVNLHLDQLNHITGCASIGFDINNSSTSGFIANFTMNPIDMSDYLNVGAAFAWLSFPIPENVISVQITLGSNLSNLSTDIYTAAVNQPHDNNAFVSGWNLLKYMLNNLSSTGNPNPKAIAYIRFDFTTNGQAIPGCNMVNIVIRKGVVYEILYNSAYCIIDPGTGAWKQFTTTNSDILPLEEDTYNILMLETALAAQKELYANNFGASTDVTELETSLAQSYYMYKLNHTDEQLEPEESSYNLGDFMNGYSTQGLDNAYGSQGQYGDYDES